MYVQVKSVFDNTLAAYSHMAAGIAREVAADHVDEVRRSMHKRAVCAWRDLTVVLCSLLR